ncbi:MAG: hypothetical protein CML37_01500, partial [Rhodobacteraceae bacterium]|nr:hypothetical protein [Paracoccaceae bacterium]
MSSSICIVFDLDGTLVHTAPALAKAGNKLLLDLKLPSVSVDTYSTFIGGGIPKQVEKLLRFSNVDIENSLEKYILRFKEHYYKNPLGGTFIYPGAKETLSELKKIYKNLVICTQKNEKPA